ncbi:MAG: phosphodiester glycosidase family protein [Pyrinomonadaceae bacterium]
MKKYHSACCFLVLFHSVHLAVLAQEFSSIREGIEYAEMTRQIDAAPVRLNLLRLDLTKVRLDVVHAMDAAIGTETVSSMATRHGAIAAINSGFFRLDRSIFAGDAVGVLKIDGKVFSESSNNRIALFIENKAEKTIVSIAHLKTKTTVSIGRREIAAAGINRERKDDDLVIFTPEFGRTTLTRPDGLEIIAANGRITEIIRSSGSNLIPQNGFVVSASGSRMDELLKHLKIGKKIEFQSSGFDLREGLGANMQEPNVFYSASEDIVAGVPELIRNGKLHIPWEQEKTSEAFVETKHPRTAVAKLKDGKFLMITVDGRSEESGGIGLEDLAKLLLEFGATDAMNLDGGGSTTMFLDGKVVNKPSDKEGERKVSDAILVTLRNK